MTERTCNVVPFLRRFIVIIIVSLGPALWSSAAAIGDSFSRRAPRSAPSHSGDFCGHMIQPRWVADNDQGDGSRNSNRQAPDDNAKLRRNLREWRSLPPETQDMLRHRMDRWRELPPQDRSRYKKRYDQLQTLPPEERHDVLKKLQQWDDLSPSDREEIRRKFPAR